MRIASLLCATLFLGSSALHATSSMNGDSVELVTSFSVAAPTKVPGKTLKPGTYSIRVIDHLSDRIILEIDGPKGKEQTKFLGLENSAIHSGTNSGPIAYTGRHGDAALRGFAFPGGSTAEFVYPKAEAVTIAKASDSRVPAIDPASEGLPAAKNLSKDDLQTVTLWMLSSTRVGPENASQPAIQAERYQPVAAPAQSAHYSAAASTSSASPQVAVQNPPTTGYVAQQRAPRLKSQAKLVSLPHTASDLPLVLLFGMLLLFAAGTTRLVRVAARARQ